MLLLLTPRKLLPLTHSLHQMADRAREDEQIAELVVAQHAQEQLACGSIVEVTPFESARRQSAEPHRRSHRSSAVAPLTNRSVDDSDDRALYPPDEAS